MTEPVDIFLGFDPGGRGNFGWSICTVDEMQFEQVCSGVGDIAEDVVNAVMGALDENDLLRANVRAAGIDAPLFWDNRGENLREADRIITRAVLPPRPLGLLLGVVLVQGPVLASLLRQQQQFEALAITEVFPRALRRALCNLHGALPPVLDRIEDETEHERDARTAAYAAWCMYRQAPGWQDLFLCERDPFLLLDFPVSYWMPIRKNVLEGVNSG